MSEFNNLEQEILQERNENFSQKSAEDPVVNPAPAEDSGRNSGKRYTLTRKGIAVMVAVCLVFSGLFGFGGALLADSLTGSSEGSTLGQGSLSGGNSANVQATDYNLATLTGSDLTIQEIIDLTANSVVEIRTEKVSTDSWLGPYVTGGAGSGVIVSGDGYILTNNHVIEGASKLTVTLKNQKQYEATLIATDSQTDVAVIKIDATGLSAAVYGDSDALKVGDLAIAIGNPLGQLGGTATAGIISALDRQLTIEGKPMTVLQTDASINPGNSGGGLFNQKGELIGIVVAKSSGSDVEGLGFAIPINQAKVVAEQLVDYGYVKGRPVMGVTIIDLTNMQSAMSYGVRTLGVYIKSVDGANAQKSGLQSGDMLYYIGETQIKSMADVTTALNGYSVGDKVKITVVRNNEMVDVNLTLSEKTS